MVGAGRCLGEDDGHTSCACKEFVPHKASKRRCETCAHKQSLHTFPSPSPSPPPEASGSSAVKLSSPPKIKQLDYEKLFKKHGIQNFQKKAPLDEATSEAMSGYHSQKKKVVKATSSKAMIQGAPAKTTYKLGSIYIDPKGVKMVKDVYTLRRIKAPGGDVLEWFSQHGLRVLRVPDARPGEDATIKMSTNWAPKYVDAFFRSLFPQVFEWLDLVFPLADDTQFHWILLGKAGHNIHLVTSSPPDGDLISMNKGPPGQGNLHHICRLVSKRRIPKAVYMDWDQAIAAAKSGCTVWKPDSDDSEADPTASESGEPGPIGKRSRSMRSKTKKKIKPLPLEVSSSDEEDDDDDELTPMKLSVKGKGKRKASQSLSPSPMPGLLFDGGSDVDDEDNPFVVAAAMAEARASRPRPTRLSKKLKLGNTSDTPIKVESDHGEETIAPAAFYPSIASSSKERRRPTFIAPTTSNPYE